jgi:hypothetical protein
MKNIIFVHIPKAAGCTLAEILRRQYRQCRCYSMAPTDYRGSVEKVRQMTVRANRKGWVLCGHQFFGMHRFFSGETRYVSILREPVERVASMYYYIKRIPTHYLYDRVVKGQMSLGEFVESGMARELDNIQVRLLCGEEADLPYGEITEKHLEIAKKNIEQFFEAVGIQDRFDETLLLMYRKLGWKKLPVYRSVNVTKSRPQVVEDAVRQRVLEINKYDLELYNWVKGRFEEELEGMDGLDELLATYVEKNRRYAARPQPIVLMKNLIKKYVLKR